MLQVLIFAGTGILAMLAEVINLDKFMSYIFRAGILACVLSIFYTGGTEVPEWTNGMMNSDSFSSGFALAVCGILALWTFAFARDLGEDDTRNDIITLVSFSIAGGMMMLSFNNLVMLFLGIEIMSIPVYVLAGASKKRLKSNEAAFKYFLMGAFASGILLFGMVFLYGATGSFDIAEIGNYFQQNAGNLSSFFKLGVMLMTFALAFKVSAVPFHFWTPDVYEGAPNAITAFMATIIKAFAVAGAFRFYFMVFGESNDSYMAGLASIAILTMLVGNFIGAVQDNPKRLLAYSSIGHVGFMLVAIMVNGTQGMQALVYYILSYSIAALLAFYITNKMLVHDDFYWSIGDFKGLGKRNKLMAAGMTLALLSMAGIPPLAGFFGKYFIFSAAFAKGHIYVVVAGILASLVAVYYYFKFIIDMYVKDADEDQHDVPSTTRENITIWVMMALIVLIGVAPDLILKNVF